MEIKFRFIKSDFKLWKSLFNNSKVAYNGNRVSDRAAVSVTVSTYGFEVSTLLSAGTTTFTLFGIGAAVILVAMAMVWRNLFLIFKKSENATLFQKDNFRMIKEIGIFAIAIPVVGLIMSAVIRLVCGVDAAEVSVHLGGILAGAVILCLNRNLIRSASSVKTAEAAL